MNDFGISKRMRKALEAHGLELYNYRDCEGIYYEGVFHNSLGWRNSVFINLRGLRPESEHEADNIACIELRIAYDNNSIRRNMRQYLGDDEKGIPGIPEPDRLLAVLQEDDDTLKRLADVAEAVYYDRPIPPVPKEATRTDTWHSCYYVIRSAKADNHYWRTESNDDLINEHHSDIRTANFFLTADEARRYVAKASKKFGIEPGTVLRVEEERVTRTYELKEGEE